MNIYKVLYFVFIAFGCACDALKDSYYWSMIYGRNKTPKLRIINRDRRNWHTIKYTGMVSFLAAGYFLCYCSISIWNLAFLLIAAAPMALEVWEGSYNYSAKGKFLN